jgi:hypothetical protein
VRHRLLSVTAWVFSLAFLVIAVREHVARGGPMLARTISSNSSNNPKSAEDTLLLYEHASKNVPRGATIAVLKPQNRADDKQVSRVSHGQLPFHRVVPQSTLDGNDAPDFVITLGAPLEDPRYERIHESAAGAIWKRVRW